MTFSSPCLTSALPEYVRNTEERPRHRTYQVVEHTLVQSSLLLPALPKLLVVVFQALPVIPKYVEAVRIDVLQPVHSHRKLRCHIKGLLKSSSLHACCTSRDLPSLLQAIQLSSSIRLCLALHVVVIVRFTSGSDEI